MKLLPAVCLALACALAVPPAPAHAQQTREEIALQNQILELRQQVQELRDQLGRAPPPGGSTLGGYQAPTGDAPPADLLAQLLSRVQRLEDDVRALRGRIDEVDNARQRQAEDLGKQIGDLKFEVENGSGATMRPATMSQPPGTLGAPPPPGEQGEAPPPPPPPPVKRTPEMILQEGNAAYGRKDFAAAEADAKAVIAASGPKTVDAQFLLARALYGKRDFSGAAVAYYDTYSHSRTGVHAPDALLGLAASLTATQEKKAACETLDKLTAEFPNLRPDLRTPVTAARRDAGCH
jgi:TolA-binding protein